MRGSAGARALSTSRHPFKVPAMLRRWLGCAVLLVEGCVASSVATPPPPPLPANPEPVPAPAAPPPTREGFGLGTPRSNPLDGPRLAAFIQRAEQEKSTSLLVVVDGQLVVEEYFGTDPERATIAMSTTKSVVGIAVGVLVDAGLLDLDRPLSETSIPEWKGGPKAEITARHLLTQTSGLATERYAEADNDWEEGSIEAHGLTVELKTPPGTVWNYNNGVSDFLSVLVRRANPEHLYLDDFVEVHLFAPLNIHGTFWLKDGHGQPRAAGELFIRPIDLAKLGQLVLDRGRWRGEQIVSEAWIEQMLEPLDVANDYGALWWVMSDRERILGYRADGYLGQYVVVVPEARLVAVRTRDPRISGDDPKEFSWHGFGWDVLALAGYEIAEADRNARGAVEP